MTNPLRYEKKMVFDGLRLDEVRSWVFFHSDAFRVAYSPRRVNNIYFDTFDRNLLMDHIDGVRDREKIRFRWYGESWQTSEGQLEIKKKRGQLGYKVIQPILSNIDVAKLNWREILGLLKTSGTEEFSLLFEYLTPVLINHYRREYYVSSDEKVRVTLDYDMRAFEQSFGFSPNISFSQPLRNDVILEMKADEKDRERMTNSIAGFPLRCLQSSKYLNGMEFVV
jgi:SPX domain protein involved in polyphosphate accumulation